MSTTARRRPHARRTVSDVVLWAVTLLAAVALVPLIAACSSVLDDAAANGPAPNGAASNGPAAGGPVASVATTSDDGQIGPEDGYIADDDPLSVDQTSAPAIGKLRPVLRQAIQQAAADARGDGIDIRITSGWRSKTLQNSLLQDAIAAYGSEQEARKYVNTPERSTHVSGDAVDVAPADAMSWLSQWGNEYGLCQTYANEAWHFEIAVAPGRTCPAPSPDASGG